MVGFIIGPIVFVLSFVMVWYNEKRCAINVGRLNKVMGLLNQSNFKDGIEE